MTQEEKNDVLHKITVMQAYVEGKTIETCDLCWNDDEEAWEKIDCPLWSWGFFDYRVAPEKQETIIKNTKKENLEQ